MLCDLVHQQSCVILQLSNFTNLENRMLTCTSRIFVLSLLIFSLFGCPYSICLWSCNYGLLLVLFFTSAFICPKWQCCLSLQFLHLDMASYNLKFFFFLMLSTFRYSQYKKMREAIDKYEGGLEAFSRGYEKMGFTHR